MMLKGEGRGGIALMTVEYSSGPADHLDTLMLAGAASLTGVGGEGDEGVSGGGVGGEGG